GESTNVKKKTTVFIALKIHTMINRVVQFSQESVQFRTATCKTPNPIDGSPKNKKVRHPKTVHVWSWYWQLYTFNHTCTIVRPFVIQILSLSALISGAITCNDIASTC